MEKETRSAIEKATQRGRKLLEADFAEQLEATHDVHVKTGTKAAAAGSHLGPEQRVLRDRIAAAIDHKVSLGMALPEAIRDYQRESAFTTLNRFVALKMLEARALILESISKGELSAGYRELCGLAPGLALLPDSAGYRLYLECVFDELSTEVKVLFDRRDPAAILWPRRGTFDELLKVLNAPELAGVWAEDETIGWVYQYFNGADERKAMREASQAPRNSRELAVRNQFFTPRYVVRFLVDNTLGRMWYDMRQSKTKLGAQCEYMVRRPHEVFLWGQFEAKTPWVKKAARGDFSELPEEPTTEALIELTLQLDGYGIADALEKAGPGVDRGDALGRWSRAVHATWESAGSLPDDHLDLWLHMFALQRGIRQIEGSGSAPELHAAWRATYTKLRTLLQRDDYTQAELLEQPYFIPFRRTKDPRALKILDPACGSGHFLLYAFDVLQVTYEEAFDAGAFGAEFADIAALRKALPELILRHNLHGIDIDPRAAQIAALALWMRAQRAFAEAKVLPRERPIIGRTNIVVAEPMPGDAAMVREFAATLNPPLLGELFTKMVAEMRLAGELGSLLKIDESIAGAVRAAREAYVASKRPGKQMGLDLGARRAAEQNELDLTGISDESFFHTAEELLLAALAKYAESGVGAVGVRRKLFAEDAVQGIAFIELMRQRYDVVLMNPPFGDGSNPGKQEFERTYSRTKNDLYAAFVERGIRTLNGGGRLGAITSRTGFFLSSFQKWREEIILKDAPPVVFADLGAGVLDNAMVETAAYCLEARS